MTMKFGPSSVFTHFYRFVRAKQQSILISLFACAALLFAYSVLIEFLFLTETEPKRRGCPLPQFEPDPFFHSLDKTKDELYDTKVGIVV